ncbi:MAG: hypothetical protein JWP87_506 [Labilithrix sp.]|nr:hypothetical protein [Labilithrix sp.]
MVSRVGAPEPRDDRAHCIEIETVHAETVRIAVPSAAESVYAEVMFGLRFLVPTATTVLVTCSAGSAAAQGTMTPTEPPTAQPPATGTPNEPPPDAPPAATAPPTSSQVATLEAPVQEEQPGAPKAHTGFQIAARVGVALPMGNLANDAAGRGVNQSDLFGAQFAAITDIGAKIIPQLFLGAYLGGNFGAAGSRLTVCDAPGASCSAFTYRIGAQLQYHIIPDGKVNPWIGYGVGYEVSRIATTLGGQTRSATAVGPEYGHLMAGVDFRLTKIFGIGPFVDFSFGQYSHLTTDEPGGGGGEINDKSMHQWLTLGVKFIFFP